MNLRFEESVELIPFGDLHIGNESCDLDLIYRYVDYIQSKDNVRVILMGDLIDANVVGYPSQYNVTMTPQEQFRTVKEIVDRIKDKVMGMVIGNHEMRIWNKAGIDIMAILGWFIENTPSAPYLYFNLSVGEQLYRVYAVHGGGMATTPAGKLNKVIRMMSWVDADIYLYGHTHLLDYYVMPTIVPSERGSYDLGNGLGYRLKYGIMTGGFLKYPAYVSTRGGMPTLLGAPRLRLNDTTWKVDVMLDSLNFSEK